MDAIILAGGKGTRLQSVVSDRPKPMADINGKPFLYYLLKHITSFKEISNIILSVGYKREIIKDYFGNKFLNIPILYSEEEELLGTGGAIRQSLTFAKTNSSIVLNGDTYFDIDINNLYKIHKENNTKISIALKKLEKFDRYGSVKIDSGFITEFKEKSYQEVGFINAGVYLIQNSIFKDYNLPYKFSFETDFMQAFTKELKIGAIVFDGYFIDIGIPEDYYKFKAENPL